MKNCMVCGKPVCNVVNLFETKVLGTSGRWMLTSTYPSATPKEHKECIVCKTKYTEEQYNLLEERK